MSVPYDSRTFTLAAKGVVGSTVTIPGPINFLEFTGEKAGFPVEVSLNAGQAWFMFQPGDKLENLGGVATVHIRNPSNGYTIYPRITYGSAIFKRRDRRGRAQDGSILCDGIISNGVDTGLHQIASCDDLMLEPNESGWFCFLKDIVIFNEGAAVAYAKFAYGTGAVKPTPGVTAPFMTLDIPAKGSRILTTTDGIRPNNLNPNTVPFVWWTTGEAWDNVAGVGLRQIRATFTVI